MMKETNPSLKSKIGIETKSQKVSAQHTGRHRKYKTAYKVTVEHWLNTRLKPIVVLQAELYPLYLEIRFKGKKTNFKSRFDINLSKEDFDNIHSNELVYKALKNELRLIESSINTEISFQGDKFIMSVWSENYSRLIADTSLTTVYARYIRNNFHDICFFKRKVDFSLLSDIYRNDWTVLNSFILLLVELGDNSFQELSKLIKAIQTLDSAMSLDTYFRDRFKNLDIYHSLILDDVSSGFLDLILSTLLEFDPSLRTAITNYKEATQKVFLTV